MPSLVETVKGAAAFDRDTLTAITTARASVGGSTISAAGAADAEQFKRYQQAQDQLGGALTHLLATREAYPTLTATQNFRDLQAQLEGTENRISVERMPCNDAAREFVPVPSRTGFPPSARPKRGPVRSRIHCDACSSLSSIHARCSAV